MVRVLLFLGGTASEKTVGKEEGANTNKVSCFISKESAGNRESEAEKRIILESVRMNMFRVTSLNRTDIIRRTRPK